MPPIFTSTLAEEIMYLYGNFVAEMKGKFKKKDHIIFDIIIISLYAVFSLDQMLRVQIHQWHILTF